MRLFLLLYRVRGVLVFTEVDTLVITDPDARNTTIALVAGGKSNIKCPDLGNCDISKRLRAHPHLRKGEHCMDRENPSPQNIPINHSFIRVLDRYGILRRYALIGRLEGNPP